jgi:hypothetical protein
MAVRFAVRAIVVFSVDLMSAARLGTHVLTKGLKRIAPTLANFNASTTVPFVVACFWVVTPVNHRTPCTVQRGFLAF